MNFAKTAKKRRKMLAVYIIIGVVVVVALAAIAIQRGLVSLKNRVDEAWSDITVQLKRRSDLIPNLVESVKAYAKHESTVFEEVSAARAGMLGAGKDVKSTAKADNALEGTLKSLFAVAESYPELKANTNFQQLSAELTDTEDKIQAARRFYNGGVRDLNTKIQMFPNSIFAGMMGYKARDFYEVDDAENAKIQDAPEVKF
jgi:LemA protein